MLVELPWLLQDVRICGEVGRWRRSSLVQYITSIEERLAGDAASMDTALVVHVLSDVPYVYLLLSALRE
jgi:ABC-type Fe3+ transport system permease subunit